MQKKGFTLIELSIVLVILGLIVGGIVGGQSLMQAARMQSIVKEANQHKTAVNAFLLQYDAWPGDFNEAEAYWGSTNNADGDGDGIIDGSDGRYVWVHLSLAEIITQAYVPLTGACNITAGVHYPASKWTENDAASNVSGAPGWAIYNLQPVFGSSFVSGARPNFLAFVSPDDNDTNHNCALERPINCLMAKRIDKKSDDGSPVTGEITGMRGHGAQACFSLSAGAEYDDLDDGSTRVTGLIWRLQ